jgi:hypothetical protein
MRLRAVVVGIALLGSPAGAAAQERGAAESEDGSTSALTLPLVVAGAGAAAVAVGGVFALLSASAYDDADEATVHEDAVVHRDAGAANAARANALFVVGASLVTIGLTWAAVEIGAPDDATRVSVGPGSVSLRGTF